MSEKEIFFKITTKLATCKTFQPLPKSVDFRGLTIVVVANEEIAQFSQQKQADPKTPFACTSTTGTTSDNNAQDRTVHKP